MKVFLARLRGEGERSQEIVGIFSAEDESELWQIIDEVCDPGAVEVLEMPSGGIHWSGPVDFKVPVPVDADGEPLGNPDLPEGYSVNEGWAGDWFGHEDREWRSLE